MADVPRKTPADARDRILVYALREFSREGYAGARMDRIATRARLSKGLIYYHFKDKDELFAAVLVKASGHRFMTDAPNDPVGSIQYWSEYYARNYESSRLLAWEGLESRRSSIVGERERRQLWKAVVERMETNVGPGGWPDFLDLRHYLVSVIAIELAPILLPQLCQLVTGKDADSPAFKREHAEFLKQFARFVAERRPPASACEGESALV